MQPCWRSDDFKTSGQSRDQRAADRCLYQTQITILVIVIYRVVVIFAWRVCSMAKVCVTKRVVIRVAGQRMSRVMINHQIMVMVGDHTKLHRHRHNGNEVHKF